MSESTFFKSFATTTVSQDFNISFRKLFLLSFLTALFLKPVLCCDKTTTTRIHQALGRIAELGTVYDETIDKFRPINLFKVTIDDKDKTISTTTSIMQTSNKTVSTISFAEAFKDMEIDFNTAMSILSGQMEVDGSARFLKDLRRKASDVQGVVFYTLETFLQELEIYSKKLKPYYNMDLLHHKGTHVVTGITWGASVAVQLRKQTLEEENVHEIRYWLRKELKILTETSPSFKDQKSNFSITFFEDIHLPFEQTTTNTLGQVRKHLLNSNNFAKTINNGKGIPIKYHLTPLTEIREHFNFKSEYETVVCKINDPMLISLTNVFDKIEILKLKIIQLQSDILKEPNCLNNQTVEDARELNATFHEAESIYKMRIKETLVCVKEKTCNSTMITHFTNIGIQWFMGMFANNLENIKLCKEIPGPNERNAEIFPTDEVPELNSTIIMYGINDANNKTMESTNRYLPTETNPDSAFLCDLNKTFVQKMKNSSDVRMLGCGGLIDLPLSGSLFLKYKSSDNLGEEQRCLWVLRSSSNSIWYVNKLRASLICEKLNSPDDTLTFYQLRPWNYLYTSFHDLRRHSVESLPSDKWKLRNFLYLNSQSISSPEDSDYDTDADTEFILHIEIVEVHFGGTSELNWFFDTVPGSLNYHEVEPSRISTIAIVPPKQHALQVIVKYVNSKTWWGACGHSDSLNIFELRGASTLRKLGILCGQIRKPITYSTNYPVVAIFYSWSGSIGTFKISWK